MAPKRVNSKVEAAKAKKDAVEVDRSARKAREDEEKNSKEWSMGANQRNARRVEEEEARAAERTRKAAEKKRLQDLEDAEAAGAKRVVKAGRKADIPPWEAALMDTGRKGRADNNQEAKKRQEETQQREEDAKPLPGTVQAMAIPVNVNRQTAVGEVATDIDSALDLLTGSGGEPMVDKHPEKRAKALYKAFEEAQLPMMREEFPGLKLSQYKERIFELWRRAPENPRNQQEVALAARR